MDWQHIAVWITVGVVAASVVRGIVRRLRGRCGRSSSGNPCCNCNNQDCPKGRINN